MVEREMARFFSGRWDRLGGYLRLWWGGPGVAWRTGRDGERLSIRVLRSLGE